MQMIGYAIDVSHHQNPDTLPWELYQGVVDLVIARTTYGLKRDLRASAHIKRARDIGARVGCYHFFRVSQPWGDQAIAFEKSMAETGIVAGDVVPTIDVEADPLPAHAAVTTKWEDPLRQLVEAMRSSFGECIVYITRRDWRSLGCPKWILERPIWVAHYTTSSTPAVPEIDTSIHPVMWQHRVGPFSRSGAGGVFPGGPGNVQIDQNRILEPLPLIGGGTWDPSDVPTVPPSA